MSNFSLKIDLTKLDGARVQTNAQGKAAIIIPIEEADLFLSERGYVYLDIDMWENRTPSPYGDTHMLKKSYSKARREILGPDVIRGKRPLGNAKERVFQQKPATEGMMVAQAPAGYTPQPAQSSDTDYIF